LTEREIIKIRQREHGVDKSEEKSWQKEEGE
jgi:hypothetical protein